MDFFPFDIPAPITKEGAGNPFKKEPKYRKARANTPQTARAIAKRQEKRVKRKKAARKARRNNR